uniref:Uncharacterized protein n=1 Tax=Vespula pensylvanica TaxID=30213 RepID=A0A834PEL7_VESPE|nr:hypothetical protein H0235_000526 [Vespula pensylvanica]
MKSTCLLLVLLNEIFLGNGGKEHIHFKIHVPEIINHHIHTKTIFIHKLVPRKKYVPHKKEIPKKKKPSFHEEEDHKDVHHEWKYWTSHFHHDDHGHDHQDDISHEVKQEEIFNEGYQDQKDFQQNPVKTDSYFPKRESHDENISSRDYTNGLVGYSYPPQYSRYSEDREISDNKQEKPTHSYEEGYRKGLQTKSGAIYTNELNKFHFGTKVEEEDERRESKDEREEEKEDEEVVKTNAGRYFVTEENVEFDHSNEGSEIK